MPSSDPFPADLTVGGDWSALARVRGADGGYITQSDVSSIEASVKNQAGAITYSASLTVGDVVYDSLQTGDPRWLRDSTGFNFLAAIPALAFAAAGRYYIVFTFTESGGGKVKLRFEGAAEAKGE